MLELALIFRRNAGDFTVTMLASSIKLTPTLPWVAKTGYTGFVTEMNQSQMKLSILEGTPDTSSPFSISVMMDENQIFSLTGQLSRGSEAYILDVEDQASVKQLWDLLGQVRKDQHIQLCRDQDVEASDRFTGFQDVHFIPEALPELSLEQLDTSTRFLTHQFDYPILITGMTGGVNKGTEINRRLALAAQKFNIPMGVGSQRVALDNDDYASIFDVKRHAPDVFLIGNLGFAQLKQSNFLELCQRAVSMVSADALAIHVNVLQEAVQMEGDRDFSQILERLEVVCKHSSVPVLVKEVGSGISPNTALRLKEAGVAAIDIGGRGGTSWGYIEGLRSNCQETKELADSFRNWGIPTAYSLVGVRDVLPHLPLIATGGIRDGHTVAKAVALGAQMAGVGLPLLRAALRSEEGPQEVLSTLVRGLKIAMIATGSRRLQDLEQFICLDKPLQNSFRSRVRSESFY